MRSVSVSQLRTEFDDFLFATIGEENGMRLSVLSALARQGLDPWQEAEQLARSSRKSAAGRLYTLIAALPNAATSHDDRTTLVADLVLLLPKQVASTMFPDAPSERKGAPNTPRALFYVTLLNLFFIALALGGQYLAASERPSGRLDHVPITVGRMSASKLSP